MVELIASCDQIGRLRVSDDIFQDISWEYVEEIKTLPEDAEKLRKYLDYAKYCSNMYNDRDAYIYYCSVLNILFLMESLLINIKT